MDSAPVRLEPEQLQQLAEMIAGKLFELQRPDYRPELNVAEAMNLTGHRTLSAFYRWTAARRVKAISFGRYRRTALLRALGE